MFLDLLVWLPIEFVKYFFRPVTGLADSIADSIADSVEAAIEEYAEEHGL